MNSHCIVTGGTSFIGRHLVRRLLKEKWPITLLVRNSSKLPEDWHGRMEIVEGDIRKKDSLSKLPFEGRIVFHLAGEIGEKSLFFDINVIGTENLIGLAAPAKIKHFIYLSSAGVIGHPGQEQIDENTPCHPLNEYERSKHEGEKVLMKYCERDQVPLTLLRPSTVFGEESKNQSFLGWMRSIKNRTFWLIGSRAFANYIYVGDVVEALLLISKGNRSSKDVFILSDTKPMQEFVHSAAKIMGVKIPGTPIPRWVALWVAGAFTPTMRFFGKTFPLTVSRVKALTDQRFFSAEKIKKELGFQPKFGIVEGLLRTLQWYEREGLL